MTDNEIIEALKHCANGEHCRFCCFRGITGTVSDCSKNFLALITRQQAKIDELVGNNDKLNIELQSMRGAANSLKMHYEEAQSEIVRLNEYNENLKTANTALSNEILDIKSEAVKEFADKVDEILKRYAHLHKYADEARNGKEEYADGTPMEMVSVWEVLSLKKWEMCDYETMNTLQDNIENIAKERILTELEKDFMLLKKELVGENNG